MLNLTTPPRSLCVLRLSSLGDCCHVVPVLRALQRAWPATRLTWVIGRAEARLLGLLPGVEFITVDKGAGLSAAGALRRALHARRFEVLLHMQLSMRASLVSLCIGSRVRLGFDRARARELQWLFTNARIEPHTHEHVLDGFLGFLAALGIEDRRLEWNLPLPPETRSYALQLIGEAQPALVVSPCSSHSSRNWSAERYARVIEHAVGQHGMRVILCGGGSVSERAVGQAIERQAQVPLINQIGRDSLPQLLALLARATAM